MQGRAKRECYDIDIEVPARPGDDRVPFLERIPRDHELDAVGKPPPAASLPRPTFLTIATGHVVNNHMLLLWLWLV